MTQLPHQPRRRRGLAAVSALAALALALGACGDDGTNAADAGSSTTGARRPTMTETPATTEAPVSSTTAPADDPGAVALAESVNLTAEDLPDEWTEEPADPGNDDEGIRVCVTSVDLDEVREGKADGSTFSQSSDSADIQVASSTIVFGSAETADTVITEVGGDAFASCALEEIETRITAGGDVEITEGVFTLNDVPTNGKASAQLSGFIATTDGTDSIEFELFLYFIRTGAVVTAVQVLSSGDADAAGTVATTTDIVAEKHAAA